MIAISNTCSTASEAVYSRFGYCVAPRPPACADDERAVRGQACRTVTEAYVKLVFTYRTCLAAEMERAVREANTVIGIVKCNPLEGPCGPTRGVEGDAPAAAEPSDVRGKR